MAATEANMKRQHALIIAGLVGVLLCVAGGAWWLVHSEREELPWTAWERFGVYPVIPPVTLPEFQLRDQSGRRFDRSRLSGKWTFVFVGYTHCPDVCPMTLATFQRMEKQLQGKKAGNRFRFIMITADPERDTEARLNAYLGFFSPNFIGLRGDESATRQFVRAFNAGFMVPDHAPGADYPVDHSAHISLISPDGRFVAWFQPPHEAKRLVDVALEIAGRD